MNKVKKLSTIALLFASTILYGCKKETVYITQIEPTEVKLNQNGNDLRLTFDKNLYIEYTELNNKPLNISFTDSIAVVGKKATVVLNSWNNQFRIQVSPKQRYEIVGVLNSYNIRTITITYLGSNVILVEAID